MVNDQESNMEFLCFKCKRADADMKCVKCDQLFHRLCVTAVQTRGSFTCDQCRDTQKAQEEPTFATLKNFGAASASTPITVAGGGAIPKARRESHLDTIGRRERQLEAENKRLREQLAEASQAQLSAPQQPPTFQSGFRASSINNRASANDHYSRNRSEAAAAGTMSRSQAAIFESISLEPLTQSQLECRRRKVDLPQFNGDPVQWQLFISSYQYSTMMCGYNHLENMERLGKALQGQARELVKHLFPFAHQVPHLVDILGRHYGSPDGLMTAMLKKADALPSLYSDLSNLGDVFGVVESLATAMDLADEAVHQQLLIKRLESKLPVGICREWFRIADRHGATVLNFREFINELMVDKMRLPTPEEAPSAKKTDVKKIDGKKERVMIQQAAPTKTVTQSKTQAPGKESCAMDCNTKHDLSDCAVFVALSVPERWRIVKGKRLCVRCFGPHWPRKCHLSGECPVPNCTWKHHKLLHDNDFKAKTASSPRKTEFVGLTKRDKTATIYKVVPVILKNANRRIDTFALMDGGSSVTMIRTELARALGLSGKPTKMSLGWTNESAITTITTECVEFMISNSDESFESKIYAQTDDELSLPTHAVTESMLKDEGFEDIPINFAMNVQPMLLIGLDNTRLMMVTESKLGRTGDVVASRTPFGWIIDGKTAGQAAAVDHCMLIKSESNLRTIVNEYIEADQFGLVPDNDVKWDSDENMRAKRLMESLTTFNGTRYETGLLWRSDDVVLPDNRAMALRRHSSLVKRLKKDPEQWRRLSELIHDYQTKLYTRRVGDEKVKSNRIWYLPVFPVIHPHKPEKVRLVWDAAAEHHGVSLNAALLTGPDLNSSLVHVLLRMRKGKIAISGDIAEMFNQVQVRPEDRPAQRFLWQDPNDEETKCYEMMVMTFGAACSPTLAQYVKNLNAARHEEEFPEAARAILNNHYVDDWLEGCDSLEEAVALARGVQEVHRRGGFQMHKWASNSSEFLIEMGACQAKDSVEVSHNSSMLLGLKWLTSDDCFLFQWRADKFGSLDEMNMDTMPTKRELLRMAMSTFDPLGLISHITILPRIILRDVWKRNIDWDVNIPEDFRASWTEWIDCLRTMTDIRITRWYGLGGGPVELHIFADASERAIAAVAYVVDRTGAAARSLVLSKCKVSPIKSKSIPRLELDAAVLATRVLDILQNANCWSFSRLVMWSDARDVLYWLRSTKREYTAYVANRVANILSKTAVEDWRWVPSAQNPADWATKFNHRATDDLWWRGPSFLELPEDDWPKTALEPDTIKEVRRVLLTKSHSSHPLLPPPEHFSSWARLVTNTACAIKFIAITRKRATEERLRWFLYRAELLVNSCPLTHLPPDDDNDLPITPNDLLLGSSSGLKSESLCEEELGLEHLREREEDIQRFWKAWTERYLPQIALRPKWVSETTPLEIGDVVFICDGDYRKGWQKGIVAEVIVDNDATQVRQVVVRTADGSRYRRGATRVAPIVRVNQRPAQPTPPGPPGGAGGPRVSLACKHNLRSVTNSAV